MARMANSIHQPHTNPMHWELVNGIKSNLATLQNQCKPIGRSMKIMPVHTTPAPIENQKLKEHCIHHLPASTNNMKKSNGPIMQRHATQYENTKNLGFLRKRHQNA